MRSPRLLLPLAVLLPLAAAAPASAADVLVVNTRFDPPEVRIQPGETVTWTFMEGSHTTTSQRGQAESWDSGLKMGGTFLHTFRTPGRYQYICIPHAPSMSGVVQVGTDPSANSFSGSVRARGLRRAARFTLTLTEAAAVTWSLKGAARKKVDRRYRAGRVTRTIRRLKPGRYTATIAAVDHFDKRSTKRVRFRVRG